MLGVVRDAAEPGVRRGDEQVPDRRVHDVERDIEQTGVRGCVAEAAVELS